MTRTFIPSISDSMQSTILKELDKIETSEDVRIIFAVESGSRAWGFPSPDSDYDVRFVYARQRDWYHSIFPGRDVIELPIDDELDISGWDIKKALGLLMKPNPVMLEWLSSPIQYIWNKEPCDELVSFSKKIAHGPACLHHYLHLGQRQWSVYVDGKEKVNLKKYFYIVRPALAIRWMRLYPDLIPPMNFQKLLEGSEMGQHTMEALDTLLKAKSQSREVGVAHRVRVIDEFIEAEFKWANEAVKVIQPNRHDLIGEADNLFRKLIS